MVGTTNLQTTQNLSKYKLRLSVCSSRICTCAISVACIRVTSWIEFPFKIMNLQPAFTLKGYEKRKKNTLNVYFVITAFACLTKVELNAVRHNVPGGSTLFIFVCDKRLYTLRSKNILLYNSLFVVVSSHSGGPQMLHL